MDDNVPQLAGDQPTPRELEILRLVANGLSNQEITERLFLTLGTVKWYLKQIYSKLRVSSRTQAIAAARVLGLLDGIPAKAPPTVLQHPLPQQATPFIGRDKELTAIARHLANPACRLLTVVGPGGIGKTRVALQAAEQQAGAYAQGIYFISLAPLSAPDSITSAVANAIGFSFYSDPAPRQQLLDYLRAKQLLLILDNFEHLLAGAGLVAEILETAPRVKILATSRERLNLQSETLFVLEGMAYPLQEFAADAGAYSAVKLFLQSAAQVQPDFALTVDNLGAVSRICRLVQGMPLGILLAAAWVGMLSVQEIAQEIQKSLDFLETEQRDLPQRQRSLRAAFNHSWTLLADEERAAFKRLSVFRGSFTREASQQAAGASLKTLVALFNKSLLRRDSATGRYEIHELLRQFGEEQLNASAQDSKQSHEQHCAYYAGYMQQQWIAMMSLRQGAVLDEIGIEFHNVLIAWNYAVEKRKADTLRGMALSLWYFCDFRIPPAEAADIFGRAAEALQLVSPTKETEIVRGLLLVLKSRYPPDELQHKADLENSLLILREYDCPEELGIALFSLALTCGFGLRQFVEGEKAAREGARIALEHDIQWLLGHCLLHIGYCLRGQGHLLQARQFGEEAYRVSEAVGDVWCMGANTLILLGGVAVDLGDYGEAERQFKLGLRWYTELESGGYPWAVAFACVRLGEVSLLTLDYEKARRWLQQSLDFFEKAQRGFDRTYSEALFAVGQLFAAQGKMEDAVSLLSFLSLVQYRTGDQFVREKVIAALLEYQIALPEEIYTAAVERGKALDLGRVVAEFLLI